MDNRKCVTHDMHVLESPNDVRRIPFLEHDSGLVYWSADKEYMLPVLICLGLPKVLAMWPLFYKLGNPQRGTMYRLVYMLICFICFTSCICWAVPIVRDTSERFKIHIPGASLVTGSTACNGSPVPVQGFLGFLVTEQCRVPEITD